ncbi:MAG: hypothetical protein JWR20_2010, partial [Marmoricola sp.]|nr:hypothetical protein [Marmoricola sp.]
DLAPPTSPKVADIRLTTGQVPPDSRTTLSSLQERCTDRRRFTAWPVPAARLLELSVAASGWGAYAVPILGRVDRSQVERMMARARWIQAADPRLVVEQGEWFDQGPLDGLPGQAASFPSSSSAHPHPTPYGPAGTDTADELVRSTEGLVVLCTADDDRTSWVRAGQSLGALWLTAHLAGLAIVPLSAVTEVRETRRALRDEVFHGGLCPQLLVRVGWQQMGRATLPRTSRRPLADVLMD